MNPLMRALGSKADDKAADARENPVIARLVVRDGKGPKGTFELTLGTYGIGRDMSNAIKILDTKASRHHCEIEATSKGCVLKDLNSRNGTFVNGAAVTERLMKDGDEIWIGEWSIVFQMAQPKPVRKERERPPVALETKDGEENSTVNFTITSEQAQVLYQDADQGPETAIKRKDILASLYEVGGVIHTLQTVDELLDKLLDLVFKVIPADRGFIFLWDAEQNELVPEAVKNEVGGADETITISKTIANKVFTDNTSVLTQDAMKDSRFKAGQSVMLHSIRSAMCVPLASPKEVHGIFYVDTKFSSGVYTEDHLKLLTAIGRQAGIAIENAKLYEEQKQTFESLMETLAATIDARDPMTAGHSQRVAEHSVGIAKVMGLSEQEQEVVRYAAYLHDYGKIGVRDAVLQKPGRLTPEEYEEIKQHAAFTASILSKIRFAKKYQQLPDMASHHHEKMDGSGYPSSLRNGEIPMGARIIAVADVFDALVSKRHYKPTLSVEEAYEELARCKGSHLDPEVVESFKRYHSQLLQISPQEARS